MDGEPLTNLISKLDFKSTAGAGGWRCRQRGTMLSHVHAFRKLNMGCSARKGMVAASASDAPAAELCGGGVERDTQLHLFAVALYRQGNTIAGPMLIQCRSEIGRG